MAQQLKLNIWKLMLKPNHKEATVNRVLFDRIRIETNKEIEEYVKETETPTAMIPEDVNSFGLFFDEYVKSFNGAFKKDSSNNKAFAPVAGQIRFSRENQIIHGFVEGGPTGVRQSVKNNSNSSTEVKTIEVSEVVSIKHYFLFWIPMDTNYAYIMLQDYSDVNTGITKAFFEHMKGFLGKYRFVIQKSPKVPRPIQNAFLDRSVVVSMDMIKTNPTRDQKNRFNPGFASLEKVKIKVGVQGLNIQARRFVESIRRDKANNPFMIDLAEIGFDTPANYTTNVYYEDAITGKRTKATITDLLNILPTIVIPDDVKIDGEEVPDFDRIYNFCNEHLSQLKIEDGYTPRNAFAD